jgi:replicative DNA helicase
MTVISTGLKDLDEATDGGIHRETLWVLASTPGKGKSTLAINFGCAAVKQGHNVLHISTGDTTERVVNLSYNQAMSGLTREEAEQRGDSAWISSVRDSAHGVLSMQSIPIGDMLWRDPGEGLNNLMKLGKDPIGLIVIDSPLGMVTSHENKTFSEVLTEVYAVLAQMARGHRIPIVVTQQCSRKKEPHRVLGPDIPEEDPDLWGIDFTPAPAHVADVLVEITQGPTEQRCHQRAWLTLLKNRYGPVVSVPVKWRKERRQFMDFSKT